MTLQLGKMKIQAPAVRKELELDLGKAVMIVVAEVTPETDAVVLKTRIFKNLAESWLKNLEMMKTELVSFDLIDCISYLDKGIKSEKSLQYT